MDFKSVSKIIGINLKHHFLPHFILSLIIAFLTPIIFGTSSLNANESAQPLEMLVSLTGIVLITPIFLPEQNKNIRDFMRSKKIAYLAVCALRLLYSVICLAIIFGIFTGCMAYSECAVTFRHFVGGFSSALFLGALGFCLAGISGNAVIGYMSSMIYYIVNFALKEDLKNYYLFSMSAGSFHEKYWLIFCSIGLFWMTFIYVGIAEKYFR